MFFKGSNIYKTPCESAKENGGFGYVDESGNDKQIATRFYEAATDEHVNNLIDAKLGVIENGSY